MDVPPSSSGWGRSRNARRVQGLLVTLGALLFLATSLYGFGGPFVYGHYGYHAGEYATRARHTLRQGALLPGNVPGSAAPVPGTYYLHHPILTPQLVTLTFSAFGDRETSLRLAALLSATATLLALTILVGRLYGPWLGAASAVLSPLVPFNVWYGPHMDHGYPGLVFVLLALLCYGRWLERMEWGDGLGALGCIAAAGCFDWTPFLFAVPWGLHVLFVAVSRRGRSWRFLLCFVGAVLVPAGIHAAAVTAAHQWDDFLGAYHTRSAAMPLQGFAEVMGIYAKDLFGVPLLATAALGLLVALARLVRGRGGQRSLALVSLAAAMGLHLAVFRVEVVTHAYRLIYLSPVVVLGTAEALAAVIAAGEWLRRPTAGRAGAAALFAFVAVATVPVSWRGLLESRAHGGIPNWKTMDPNLPRTVLARVLRDRSRLGDRLYLHASFPFRMDLAFYLDRDLVPATVHRVASLPPAEQARALFAFAPTSLTPTEREAVARLAEQHPLTRIGSYAIIDLRSGAAPETAFTLAYAVPARLGWWQRYWQGPYPWPALVRDKPTR